MSLYDNIMTEAQLAVNDNTETFDAFYAISECKQYLDDLEKANFLSKEQFVPVYQRMLINNLLSAVWLRVVNNRALSDRKVWSEADAALQTFEKSVKSYTKR